MKYYLDIREDEGSNYLTLFERHTINGILKQEGKDVILVEIEDSDPSKIKKTLSFEVIVINNSEDMQSALSRDIVNDTDAVLVQTSDWHIIPLENLIAKFAKKQIDLLTVASTPEDVSLLNNILELGVNGIILQQSDEHSFEDLLNSEIAMEESQKLVELEVVSKERMGNGDRVCVDTCSILQKGEGLLVGSTAAVLALVEAEVEESGFVRARPFRINAGVVASYMLNFDKTNYLSELKAGSAVMVINREGKARKENIARVKIERRPLLLLKVAYEEREYPIILQDAETVKLMTVDSSIRVTDLQPGEKVLCYISNKARHFGMEIDEFLEER